MIQSTAEIHEFFQKNGYYHARGVFSPDEVVGLERDFDRIVQQIATSGEEVDARWTGAAMDKIAPKNSAITHTHNVQIFSSLWLRAFLQAHFVGT